MKIFIIRWLIGWLTLCDRADNPNAITSVKHYHVTKRKHFPRYWPFVRGIHWSLVNSPHKGQWRRALRFFLICVWMNSWINNREAGDLRRYRAHYHVTVMTSNDWRILSFQPLGPILCHARSHRRSMPVFDESFGGSWRTRSCHYENKPVKAFRRQNNCETPIWNSFTNMVWIQSSMDE